MSEFPRRQLPVETFPVGEGNSRWSRVVENLEVARDEAAKNIRHWGIPFLIAVGATIGGFEYFADQAGLPTKLVVSVAKETVQRFRTVWQKEHRHLPLARTTLKIIEKHAKSIPLYEEMG